MYLLWVRISSRLDLRAYPRADLLSTKHAPNIAVLVQVEAFLAKISSDVNVVSLVTASLTPLINGLVATYKAAGIFSSSTAASPAPAAAA